MSGASFATITPETAAAAVRHLRRRDRVLAAVIKAAGPCTLTIQRQRFKMLARSIISQQISTGAARAIRARLEALSGRGGLTAANIQALSAEQLRSAGLSGQKARYLHELAAAVIEKRLRLSTLSRFDDEEVIAQLTALPGIGRWTAQMFLMFSLGRLDVFPHDDFGVRSAIRQLYGLSEMPNRAASHAVAECWRPYATVASWYCWRSLDLRKSKKVGLG